MPTATLYPDKGINYIRFAETWSSARAGGGTPSLQVTNGSVTVARTLLSYQLTPSSGFYFYRPYFDFDLSPIPNTSVIQEMSLHLCGTSVMSENVWLGYGGNGSLSQIDAEYNLVYSGKNLRDGKNLGKITDWIGNRYSSSSLDIVTYPPTLIDPGKGNPTYWAYYTIGCVSDADWNNNIFGTSRDVRFIGATPGLGGSTNQPYLTVTYTVGYPNMVMGIPGANITTVSGVPAANITNIMGV